MVRSLLSLALVVPVLALAPATASQPAASPARGPAAVAPSAPAPVRVATINLREGSLQRQHRDVRTATDRAALARRLLGRPGPVPDVVLAQEVLGTASRTARALNAVLAASGRAQRYAVATGTRRGFATGQCDGPRQGRFSVLRSSAILVNTSTVTEVAARGVIRTWGRWNVATARIIGRASYGCSEHPWARLRVATSGGPRTVTAVNVHVAPRATRLKTSAIATLRRGLQDLTRATPTGVAVLGGDFNLPRCGRDGAVERRGCHVRPAHRALHAAGFRDAVRTRAPSGPRGVAGVARRIDFLYVRGPVREAWWDRCYQAYRVTRWRCTKPVFASPVTFVACQDRAQRQGRAGGACPARHFRGYYSDHPLVTATIG